jgi:tRNA pseudouridine32 synthase/23S rRNA pseudouridine746 synthase
VIDILFEDAEALVIDKPAGLPMDTPRRGGEALTDHLPDLTLGFARLPVPCHRLDADTSGCLLLARNPKAAKRFMQAFAGQQVAKRYLGVLDGEVAEDGGTIALALKKVSTQSKGWRMVPARGGKPAVTAWRVRARHGGRSLVEFIPETGRTHQIRVHAASGIGLPLLGDPVYGRGVRGRDMTVLHAASLSLPRGDKPPVTASAPLPARFAALGFEDDPG